MKEKLKICIFTGDIKRQWILTRRYLPLIIKIETLGTIKEISFGKWGTMKNQ